MFTFGIELSPTVLINRHIHMFDLFKTKIHVGLWIIILLLTSSCKKEQGPTGMVYGKVYFAGTTVPVINMAVAVDDFSDTTNERGYFRIDNIPIGSYNLVTHKKDFTPFQSDISISTVATELNIETSSELFTSAISGQIIGDKTLEPKAEVRIIILNPNGTESKLQTTSDENGKYEINNIPQGERTLILKSGSFEFLPCIILLVDFLPGIAPGIALLTSFPLLSSLDMKVVERSNLIE